MRNCELTECGKPFEPTRAEHKYCSHECASRAWYIKKRGGYVKGHTATCHYCKQHFEYNKKASRPPASCKSPGCQAKDQAHKKQWRADYWLTHKRGVPSPHKEIPEQEKPRKLRYCKYEFCRNKRVALPNGWYLYHPKCYDKVVDSRGRGIDQSYDVTI